MINNQFWQECPKCKGAGYTTFMGIYYLREVCHVCKGKMIISTLNGKPPKD